MGTNRNILGSSVLQLALKMIPCEIILNMLPFTAKQITFERNILTHKAFEDKSQNGFFSNNTCSIF